MLVLVSLSAKPKFIILYHGSGKEFNTFSLDSSAEGGVFLTPSKVRAQRFGKILYTVRVDYDNMYEVDGKKIPEEHELEDIEKVIADARRRRCDLIKIKGFRDYGAVGDMYIALDVAKLKVLKRS